MTWVEVTGTEARAAVAMARRLFGFVTPNPDPAETTYDNVHAAPSLCAQDASQ